MNPVRRNDHAPVSPLTGRLIENSTLTSITSRQHCDYMESPDSPSRRAALSTGFGLGVALAGCIGISTTGDDDDPENPTEDPPAATHSPHATEDGGYTDNYSIDHPITDGAENDPFLGPPPDKAEMGIILVSEPSCPYCRKFDDNVFEKLYADYIEPGHLAYVYRPYPKVRDWATTAAYGMLATWERKESAWLPLKRWYYGNSDELGAVIDLEERTADFLNQHTAVDGEAVAEAMENFEQVDALAETAVAVREAGMTTIPSYAIIDQGEVVLTTSGVQSYDNLKTMLGAD